MIAKRPAAGALALAGVLLSTSGASAQLSGFPDQARSCPAGSWPCPDSGRVEVDLDFNFNTDEVDVDGDGVVEQYIDSDELQCALDCLDGDADQEHSLRVATIPLDPPVTLTEVPEVIPGGELRLTSRLLYRLVDTVRLPLRATGRVRIDGRGARVFVAMESGAALRRDVLGQHCAANHQRLLTRGWTIQDVRFLADRPGSGTGSLIGVSLSAAEQLRIESSRFGPARDDDQGFDVAVGLAFVRNGVLDAIEVSGSRVADVVVGEAGLLGATEAWAACACTEPAAPFSTDAVDEAACIADDASDGTLLVDTRHHGAHSTSTRARIGACTGCVVGGSAFTGSRARHAVHRTGSGENVLVRDVRFDADGCDAAQALVVNEGPGLFVLDSIVLGGSQRCTNGPDLVYQARQAAATKKGRTAIRSVADFHGVLLDAGAGDGSFHFEALAEALPLTDASAWSSPVPERLAVSASQYVILPSAPPGGREPTERQLWMDRGELKFCCAPTGATRLLTTEP